MSLRPTATSPRNLALIAVIAIGAIIAILPQSPAARSDVHENLLAARLSTVRNAIALYQSDHGVFPGPTADQVLAQLTATCDVPLREDDPAAQSIRVHPYLVELPACPVGSAMRSPHAADVVITTASPPRPITESPAGWVYNPATGEIIPNASGIDTAGRPFTTY